MKNNLEERFIELRNENSKYSIRVLELEQELQKTREQLEKAEKVIEFYGKESHWLGLADKVPFDVLKWIRIVEDDMDENNLGGIRARQYFQDKDKQGEG